jgi:hypothetical protein
MLESLLEEDERKAEPLFYFCKEYPSLCEEENNSCSIFFKVVKQFNIRFQHGIVNDEDKIYMILHSQYRRISNLNLNNVMNFLLAKGEKPSVLKGIRVNLKMKDATELYEIEDVVEEGGIYLFKLACNVSAGKRKEKSIELNELDKYNISINPTYKNSRLFIEQHLCKEFDKHKDLSKITPNTYFDFLKNDLSIFRKLVAQYASNGLTIGGVSYTIEEDFVKVKRI